jgi:hypothetical protein
MSVGIGHFRFFIKTLHTVSNVLFRPSSGAAFSDPDVVRGAPEDWGPDEREEHVCECPVCQGQQLRALACRRD